MRKWSALIVAVSATAALLVGTFPAGDDSRPQAPERAIQVAGFGR